VAHSAGEVVVSDAKGSKIIAGSETTTFTKAYTVTDEKTGIKVEHHAGEVVTSDTKGSRITAGKEVTTFTRDYQVKNEDTDEMITYRAGRTVTTEAFVVDGRSVEVSIVKEPGAEGTAVSVNGKQANFGENVKVAVENGKLVVSDARGVREFYDGSGENVTGRWQGIKNGWHSMTDKIGHAWNAAVDNCASNYSFVGEFSGWGKFGMGVLAALATVGEATIMVLKVAADIVVFALNVVGTAVSFTLEWATNILNAPQAIMYYMQTGRSLGGDAVKDATDALAHFSEKWIDRPLQWVGNQFIKAGEFYAGLAEHHLAQKGWTNKALGALCFTLAVTEKAVGQNLTIIILVTLTAIFPVFGGVLGALFLAKDAIVNGLGNMFHAFFVEPFVKLGHGLTSLIGVFFGVNQYGMSGVRTAINALTEIAGAVVGIVFAWQMVKGAAQAARSARMEVLMKDNRVKLQEGIKNMNFENVKPDMPLGRFLEKAMNLKEGTFKGEWAKTPMEKVGIKSGEGIATLGELVKDAKGIEALKGMLSHEGFRFGDLMKMDAKMPSHGAVKGMVDRIMRREPAPTHGPRPITEIIKPASNGMRGTTRGMGTYVKTFGAEFAHHQAQQFTQAAKGVAGKATQIAEAVSVRVTEMMQMTGRRAIAIESGSVRASAKGTQQGSKGQTAGETSTRRGNSEVRETGRTNNPKSTAGEGTGRGMAGEVARAEARTASVERALGQARQNLEAAKQGKIAANEIARLEGKVQRAEKALETAKAEEAKIKDLSVKQQEAVRKAGDKSEIVEGREQAAIEGRTLDVEARISSKKASAAEMERKIEGLKSKKEMSTQEKKSLASLEKKLASMKDDISKMEQEGKTKAKTDAKRELAEQAVEGLAEGKPQSQQSARFERSRAMRLSAEVAQAEGKTKVEANQQKIKDLDAQMSRTTNPKDYLDLLKQKGSALAELRAAQAELAKIEQRVGRAQAREAASRIRDLAAQVKASGGVNMSEGQIKRAIEKAAKNTAADKADRPGLAKALAVAMTQALAGKEIPLEAAQALEGATGAVRMRALADKGMSTGAQKMLEQMCERSGITDRAVKQAMAEKLGLTEKTPMGKSVDPQTVNAALAELFGSKESYGRGMTQSDARAQNAQAKRDLQQGFVAVRKSHEVEAGIMEGLGKNSRLEGSVRETARGRGRDSVREAMTELAPDELMAALNTSDPVAAMREMQKAKTGRTVKEVLGSEGSSAQVPGDLRTQSLQTELAQKFGGELEKMGAADPRFKTPEQRNAFLREVAMRMRTGEMQALTGAQNPVEAMTKIQQRSTIDLKSLASPEAWQVSRSLEGELKSQFGRELEQAGRTDHRFATETQRRNFLREVAQKITAGELHEVMASSNPLETLIHVQKRTSQAGPSLSESLAKATTEHIKANQGKLEAEIRSEFQADSKSVAGNMTPEQFRQVVTAENPLEAIKTVKEAQTLNPTDAQAQLTRRKAEIGREWSQIRAQANELRQQADQVMSESHQAARVELAETSAKAKQARSEAAAWEKKMDKLGEKITAAQREGRTVLETETADFQAAKEQAQQWRTRAEAYETALKEGSTVSKTQAEAKASELRAKADALLAEGKTKVQQALQQAPLQVRAELGTTLKDHLAAGDRSSVAKSLQRRAAQVQAAENSKRLKAAQWNAARNIGDLTRAAEAIDKAEVELQTMRTLANDRPTAGFRWSVGEIRARIEAARVRPRLVAEMAKIETASEKQYQVVKDLEAALETAKSESKGVAEAEAKLRAANAELQRIEGKRIEVINDLLRRCTNLQYRFLDVTQESVRNALVDRINEIRKQPGFQPKNLNDQIMKAMADNVNIIADLYAKEGIKYDTRDKQLTFAYKVAEHFLLTYKLREVPALREIMGGEALRLAAGYGKEDGNSIGLVSAYKIIKAETGKAPKFLFATSAPDLVSQMGGNRLMKTMGNEVTIVEKGTALGDPARGGIFLMDQKTCQEILLEAKSGNVEKAKFLKSFDAGTVDEIQAALSSTPVIHGISGQILEKIFADLPDAYRNQTLRLADMRIEVMREVLREFLVKGEDYQATFRTRQISESASQRQAFELVNKAEVLERVMGKEMFRGLARDEVARMLDMGADAIMKVNGRDYHGEWGPNGEFDYHVMGNGKLMRHTVFGDSELAAMVAVKENLTKGMQDVAGKKVTLTEAFKQNSGLLDAVTAPREGTAMRLLHFKTGEATFLEMMNYVGKERFIVGSATLEGNRQGLKALGFRITSLTGESELSLTSRVEIEPMKRGEQSRIVGEADQVFFKAGDKVYEVSYRDGQTVVESVSARDYLVKKLAAERATFDTQVVTDINNGKHGELFESLIRSGEFGEVNAIRTLEDLKAAGSKKGGTDIILIGGHDNQMWKDMIDMVKEQIKADPSKKRIVLGMGIGEGSNMLAETKNGKYTATIWKTNLEAYDKTAQTARRIDAPGRTEGTSRTFIDLDAEANFKPEELGRLRNLIAEGKIVEARDGIVHVTREILKEIDSRQASSIAQMLKGVSTSDIVEVREKVGEPTAAEMAMYKAKAMDIIDHMQARTGGFEKVGRDIMNGARADKLALRSAITSASQQSELMKSYMGQFEQANPNNPQMVTQLMTEKFGADWKAKMALAEIQLTPENYRRKYEVTLQKSLPAWSYNALQAVGGFTALNFVMNKVAPAITDFFAMRKAAAVVGSVKTEYVKAMRDAAQVSTRINELTPGMAMHYHDMTMNRPQAERFVQERLQSARAIAAQYGLKMDNLNNALQQTALESAPKNAVAAALSKEIAKQTNWLDRLAVTPLQRGINRLDQATSRIAIPAKPVLQLAGIGLLAIAGFSSQIIVWQALLPALALSLIPVVAKKWTANLQTASENSPKWLKFMGQFAGRSQNAKTPAIVALAASAVSLLTPAGFLGTAASLIFSGALGTLAGKAVQYGKDYRELRSAMKARDYYNPDVVVVRQSLEEMPAETTAAFTLVETWREAVRTNSDDYMALQGAMESLGVSLNMGVAARHKGYLHMVAAIFDLIPAFKVPAEADKVVPKIWSHLRTQGIDGVDEGVRAVDVAAPTTQQESAAVMALAKDGLGFFNQSFAEQLMRQACERAVQVLFADTEGAALQRQLEQAPIFKELGPRALREFIRQYVMEGRELASRVESHPQLAPVYARVKQAFGGKVFDESDLIELSAATVELENEGFAKMKEAAAAIDALASPAWRTIKMIEFDEQFAPMTYAEFKASQTPTLAHRFLRVLGQLDRVGKVEKPVSMLQQLGRQTATFGLGVALAGGIVAAFAGFAMALPVVAVLGGVVGVAGLAVSGQGLAVWRQAEKLAFAMNPSGAVNEQMAAAAFKSDAVLTRIADMAKASQSDPVLQGEFQSKYNMSVGSWEVLRGKLQKIRMEALANNPNFKSAVAQLNLQGATFSNMVWESKRTDAIDAVLKHLQTVINLDHRTTGGLPPELRQAFVQDMVDVLGLLEFDVQIGSKGLTVVLTPTPTSRPILSSNYGKIGTQIETLRHLGVDISGQPTGARKQPKLKLAGSAA